jgi:hypothetical protein
VRALFIQLSASSSASAVCQVTSTLNYAVQCKGVGGVANKNGYITCG